MQTIERETGREAQTVCLRKRKREMKAIERRVVKGTVGGFEPHAKDVNELRILLGKARLVAYRSYSHV